MEILVALLAILAVLIAIPLIGLSIAIAFFVGAVSLVIVAIIFSFSGGFLFDSLEAKSIAESFFECVSTLETDQEAHLKTCASEYLADSNEIIDPAISELIASWGEPVYKNSYKLSLKIFSDSNTIINHYEYTKCSEVTQSYTVEEINDALKIVDYSIYCED